MKTAEIVAIINLTPDSFSDGNLYQDSATLFKNLDKLSELEVKIIDLGAVSTRPGAKIPSIDEELSRIKKFLPILAKFDQFQYSIDSFHYPVVKFLLDHLPIRWINDQTAFKDHQLLDLAVKHQLKVVLMHHLTIPTSREILIPNDQDIIAIVKNWFQEKSDYLLQAGVLKENIILDPGIGFNKTFEASWTLIKKANELVELGYNMLYGHSRKSFLNKVTNLDFVERDLETAYLSLYLANQGVKFLRVHNPEYNLRMLKINQYFTQV